MKLFFALLLTALAISIGSSLALAAKAGSGHAEPDSKEKKNSTGQQNQVSNGTGNGKGEDNSGESIEIDSVVQVNGNGSGSSGQDAAKSCFPVTIEVCVRGGGQHPTQNCSKDANPTSNGGGADSGVCAGNDMIGCPPDSNCVLLQYGSYMCQGWTSLSGTTWQKPSWCSFNCSQGCPLGTCRNCQAMSKHIYEAGGDLPHFSTPSSCRVESPPTTTTPTNTPRPTGLVGVSPVVPPGWTWQPTTTTEQWQPWTWPPPTTAPTITTTVAAG